MTFPNSELAKLMLASGTIAFGAAASGADLKYPLQPITLIVGYSPGGGAGALAQILSKYMTEDLGQKVIIDYRPGAGSNIAAESAARAAPNGYTVFLGGRPNTIHKSMYKDIKYDFGQDLAPVGLVATMPFVLVTGNYVPIENPHDIVEIAKANPGKLTCASGGVGTTDHLLCELLQQEAGIDLLHVPYGGSAPALTDLISGQVDMLITPLPSAIPHITAGTLRAIAVVSPGRVPAMSHIPTIGEYGFLGGYGESWYGLMAPTGTQDQVIARLNGSINAAWADPNVQELLKQIAYVAPLQPNTPEMLGKFIGEETERWSKILQLSEIQARD
jgi:tripartite-type tricarboxylate transporter receptor subunit TctC